VRAREQFGKRDRVRKEEREREREREGGSVYVRKEGRERGRERVCVLRRSHATYE